MRKSFDAYPELLIVDAMHCYKLDDLHIYVLQNVDGNSQSEIICFWIMKTPDFDSISFLVEKFKERNAKWSDIKAIMADKDMVERKVLIQKFPAASVLICLFHSLRIFKRELKKMVVSVQQRDLASRFFDEMALSNCENEYNSIYERFKQTVPSCVAEYFLGNWHEIRHQWVKGLQNVSASFLNNASNNLDFINYKIKDVILENSEKTFLRNLLKCLDFLEQKRELDVADMFLEKSTFHSKNKSITDLAIKKYEDYLTPLAFSYVEKQHKGSSYISVIEELGSFSVKTNSKTLGDLNVHCDFCPCEFFKSLMLPCKHIFAARLFFKLSLFEKSLCSNRWTLCYLKADNHIPDSVKKPFCRNKLTSKTRIVRQGDVLTKWQKYKQAQSVTFTITELMSQLSQSVFNHNMQVLDALKTCLIENGKVTVGQLESELDIIKGKFCIIFI